MFKRKNKKKLEVAKESSYLIEDTTIDNSPFKRIATNSKSQYIELAYDNGYAQLLAIQGEDFRSMNIYEERNLLESFRQFLTDFSNDFSIYTTQLPTDTHKQVENFGRLIYNIRKNERPNVRNERILKQQEIRHQILLKKQRIEKSVEAQLLNVEYILILFGDTPKELDSLTDRAITLGNRSLKLETISLEKKKQIFKQFNNMNTPL